MLGRAFLQCRMDGDSHRGLRRALGLDERRNQFLTGRAGSPIKQYWVADIVYDAFGHLFFFGIEVDFQKLLGDMEPGGDGRLEELDQGLRQCLLTELGDAALVLPALQGWDCNTMQFMVQADPQRAQSAAQAAGIAVEQEAPIVRGGKHASGSVRLSVLLSENKAWIVATCRRGKLNSLLGIRGLADRPPADLLALDASAVVEAVWRRATRSPLPL